MTKKGFVKLGNDNLRIQQQIARLNGHGIATENIVIAKDCPKMIQSLKKGETMVICSLSDICKGVSSLLNTLQQFIKAEAMLESLDETWLDMTAGSHWQETIDGLHRFSRRMHSENTKQGLDKVKASGQTLGRPRGYSKQIQDKIQTCLVLYQSSMMSVREICEITKIHPRTFYRYMNEKGLPLLRRNNPAHKTEPEPALQGEPAVG